MLAFWSCSGVGSITPLSNAVFALAAAYGSLRSTAVKDCLLVVVLLVAIFVTGCSAVRRMVIKSCNTWPRLCSIRESQSSRSWQGA